MKLYAGILLAAVAIIVPVARAFGQPNKDQPLESLRGVTGVHVVVRYHAPNENTFGLTKHRLQNDVELRLAANDVKVYSKTDWHLDPAEPYLYVNVVGTPLETHVRRSSGFLFNFSVSFIQNVSLVREPLIVVEGCTWTEGDSVVIPRDRLGTIAGKVSDLAYEFVKA